MAFTPASTFLDTLLDEIPRSQEFEDIVLPPIMCDICEEEFVDQNFWRHACGHIICFDCFMDWASKHCIATVAVLDFLICDNCMCMLTPHCKEKTDKESHPELYPIEETDEEDLLELYPIEESDEESLFDLYPLDEADEEGILDLYFIDIEETDEEDLLELYPLEGTEEASLAELFPIEEAIRTPKRMAM